MHKETGMYREHNALFSDEFRFPWTSRASLDFPGFSAAGDCHVGEAE
jgi:hypothetical protein